MIEQLFSAGIVGCGRIAGKYNEVREGSDVGGDKIITHASMFQANPRFCLKAACDKDPQRLGEFCRYWGIEKAYTSFDEFCQAGLDVVSVCTPDEAHYVQMKTLLAAAAKVIVVEKPLSLAVCEAQELLELAEQSSSRVIVDYLRRFDEYHQALVGQIRGGVFGSIYAYTGHYVRGLRHNGIHHVNLLRWLFGEPDEVSVLWSKKLPDGDVCADLALRFGATTALVLAADKTGYRYSVFEWQLSCEAGILDVRGDGVNVLLRRPRDSQVYAGFRDLVAEVPCENRSTMGQAFVRLGEEMVAALTAEVYTPKSTLQDGLRDLAIVEQVIAATH